MNFTTKLFDQHKMVTAEFADFLKIADIPGYSLNEVDEALQNRFFQKNDDGTPKERWQLAGVDAPSLQVLWEPLRRIGMIDAVNPPAGSYEGALVLGALLPRVDPRYSILAEVAGPVRFQEIYLLGGANGRSR